MLTSHIFSNILIINFSGVAMLDQYRSKQKNKMGQILDRILRNRQITRSELAETLSISSSSVVKYTRELIDVGLIREKGRSESTGGRRSSYLEFDPSVGVNLVVHFKLSHLEGALVNPVGELVYRKREPLKGDENQQELLNTLLKLTGHLKNTALKKYSRVFGMGIGIGDHINMVQGISYYYHRCQDWKNVPLKEILEKELELPFYLINDVDAAALGEMYYGLGRDLTDFLCLWDGETLGMGIVLNDQLYQSNTGLVGEIGHLHAVSQGDLCVCGNRGCLETVSTEPYILRRCRELLREGVKSGLTDVDNSMEWTIKMVVDLSNQGDRICRNVMEEVAGYMGLALTDVANLFHPKGILLGGPVMENNHFLLENIQRIVSNRALKPICDDVKILSSESADMPLIGIGAFVLSQLLL